MHHERNIPEVTPEELKALREQRRRLLILDVRTPEEYGRFCIPGGVNVPGGDLILWAEELKQKRDATVVVNCAGRTRSIIGTAALRRLGLTNVRALKNGTMGWVLAGLELETKPARQSAGRAVRKPCNERRRWRHKSPRKKKLRGSPRQQLSDALASMNKGVTYLIDVRSEAEFEAGHISRIDQHPGRPGGAARRRFRRRAKRADHFHQQRICTRRDGRLLVSANGISACFGVAGRTSRMVGKRCNAIGARGVVR